MFRDEEVILLDDKTSNETLLNQTLENLPQDVINLISNLLSYKQDLVNLRLSCKEMDKLVENTPEGKIAREAQEYNSSSLTKFINSNSDDVMNFGITAGSLITLAVCLIGFYEGLGAWIFSKTFFIIIMSLMSMFVGAVFGGIAANVAIDITSDHLFFNTNKQKEIRSPLSMPAISLKLG